MADLSKTHRLEIPTTKLSSSRVARHELMAKDNRPWKRLADRVRLHHKIYWPERGIEATENKSRDYLVVLPLRHGQIKLERDDAVLFDGAVQPGIVRIVQPGERSRMQAESEFDSAIFTVEGKTFCETAHAFKFPNNKDGLPKVKAVLHAGPDIKRIAPLLSTAFELQNPQCDLLTAGLLMTVLAFLFNADHNEGSKRPFGFDSEQFEAVLKFARLRLSQRLDLSEWAKSVSMSNSEFARRFQQHTGLAPYTWFLDRRIEKAKRQMMESEKALVEVALDSGFCSQAHFTETFHRRVGVSPGRWRSGQKNRTAERIRLIRPST